MCDRRRVCALGLWVDPETGAVMHKRLRRRDSGPGPDTRARASSSGCTQSGCDEVACATRALGVPSACGCDPETCRDVHGGRWRRTCVPGAGRPMRGLEQPGRHRAGVTRAMCATRALGVCPAWGVT